MFRKFSSMVLFFLAVAALFAIFVHAEKGRADSRAASQPQTTDTKVVAYYFHLNYAQLSCSERRFRSADAARS